MSFSLKVKKEIFESQGPRHCKIAEISAIIDMCGIVSHHDGRVPISIKSENALVNNKFFQILQENFNKDYANMLLACKSANIKSECCKRAYIGAAFMCVGTMADPKKAYHLEIIAPPKHIDEMRRLLIFFGLSPKIHSRKSSQLLYLKEAEQIATVLNIMGAHVALMEFENCRVDKDVNNDINRVSNAAAANEDKMIKASAKHVTDILDIQKLAGLGTLSDSLSQVAQIRLDNPLLSLENIGKMLEPPISKSGVNHRLKKIAKIADKYRTEAYND